VQLVVFEALQSGIVVGLGLVPGGGATTCCGLSTIIVEVVKWKASASKTVIEIFKWKDILRL